MATFTITSISTVNNESATVISKDDIGSEYTHIIDYKFVENWFYTENGYSKKHELRAGAKYEITNKVKHILCIKFIEQ